MNIVILARSSIKCFKYLELATGSGINSENYTNSESGHDLT